MNFTWVSNLCNDFWLVQAPRAAAAVFIIFNLVAMQLSPGGTVHNPHSENYHLTQNFFSDLGRTMTFSGEVNFLSSQFFNMSLILAGSVFALFYLQVRKVFTSDKQKILAFIGSLFGILGGISLAGVGLTPADLYLDLHIICANWLFRFMCIASLFYTVVIFSYSELKNKYAGGYMVFTVSILLYILISELGPDPKISYFALVLQVVSQKIILLILMAAIYIQTLGLQKLQK